MADFTIVDNTAEVLAALQNAKKRGLEAIGATAARHAQEVLSSEVYVDDPDRTWILTGRLRNSITYALSGQEAHIKEYKADGGTGGQYQGTAPDDKETAVYIGTNVEYAAGIELGTHRRKGAVHFLQKAATEPTAEYQQLMEESLKNA